MCFKSFQMTSSKIPRWITWCNIQVDSVGSYSYCLPCLITLSPCCFHLKCNLYCLASTNGLFALGDLERDLLLAHTILGPDLPGQDDCNQTCTDKKALYPTQVSRQARFSSMHCKSSVHHENTGYCLPCWGGPHLLLSLLSLFCSLLHRL